MSAALRLEVWPALLTTTQAAAYLSCSPRTIDSLQRQGELIPVDTGFGKRFPRKNLDRFVETRDEWESK